MAGLAGKKSKDIGYNNNNELEAKDNSIIEEENEELLLATNEKLTKEDIDFVISTMNKEAKYDLISIKQLFFGMSSAFSKLPISHNVNSKDAGSGKSYLVTLIGEYFPSRYVLPLTGMSDKALIHRPGILVIERTNIKTGEPEVVPGEPEVVPIRPIIDGLDLEKDELLEENEELKKNGNNNNKTRIKQNKERIKDIESEVEEVKRNAEKLIDLNNQIILGLDTPQDSAFDATMGLISQDNPRDQKYSFVEKSQSGKIGTRVNRLRGTSSLLQGVVDDSRTVRFQEKNRRFINVTPDTSEKNRYC